MLKLLNIHLYLVGWPSLNPDGITSKAPIAHKTFLQQTNAQPQLLFNQ